MIWKQAITIYLLNKRYGKPAISYLGAEARDHYFVASLPIADKYHQPLGCLYGEI